MAPRGREARNCVLSVHSLNQRLLGPPYCSHLTCAALVSLSSLRSRPRWIHPRTITPLAPHPFTLGPPLIWLWPTPLLQPCPVIALTLSCPHLCRRTHSFTSAPATDRSPRYLTPVSPETPLWSPFLELLHLPCASRLFPSPTLLHCLQSELRGGEEAHEGRGSVNEL